MPKSQQTLEGGSLPWAWDHSYAPLDENPDPNDDVQPQYLRPVSRLPPYVTYSIGYPEQIHDIANGQGN